METMLPHPFENIAARSERGQPLLLRLRDNRGRWLRVHQDGSLEVAGGDHRHDKLRREFGSLSSHLLQRAHVLHAELCNNFRPDDLGNRSGWDHFYPVQAFAGESRPAIEGFIGVESEMGMMTDVFGFRDDRNARQNVWTLQELLELIPR